MLIVWDTRSGAPVRTYFGLQQGGCAAVAMSADAMYVVSLSVATPQLVSVWQWTAADCDGPLFSCSLEGASLMVGPTASVRG